MRQSAAAAVTALPEIKVGTEFWLELRLENASDIVLLESALQYEQEKLSVITSEDLPVWENGELVADPSEFDVRFTNIGTLAISALPADVNNTIAGSGILLKVRFAAKQAGATAIVWTPDSAAYVPDPDIVARKIDATFKDLTFGVLPAAGSLVILLNIVPA